MSPLHHYRLFGLQLASERPLQTWPLGPASPAEPDVHLRFDMDRGFWDEAERSAEPFRERAIGDAEPLRIARLARGWLWTYPDATRFFIADDASEICATWPDDYVLEDALTYLLGPIIGFALRLLGVRSLHASAAVVDGNAVGFVGDRGAGKSTLAAAMYARGYRVLSEDVTAIRPPRTALPGLPLVKLWQDSAERHGDLPLMTPNWSKRYLSIEDRFASEPVEIGALYLLGVGERPAIEDVGPGAALATLLNNVYVSYALSETMRADDLQFFGDLVERVPVRRLIRTRSFDDLDELIERVQRERETFE